MEFFVWKTETERERKNKCQWNDDILVDAIKVCADVRSSLIVVRHLNWDLFSFSFSFDLSPARSCSVLVYDCYYCFDVLCVCVHWCCWWWGVVCFRMSFSYNNRPISRVRIWPHSFGHLQNYSRLLLFIIPYLMICTFEMIEDDYYLLLWISLPPKFRRIAINVRIVDAIEWQCEKWLITDDNSTETVWYQFQWNKDL